MWGVPLREVTSLVTKSYSLVLLICWIWNIWKEFDLTNVVPFVDVYSFSTRGKQNNSFHCCFGISFGDFFIWKESFQNCIPPTSTRRLLCNWWGFCPIYLKRKKLYNINQNSIFKSSQKHNFVLDEFLSQIFVLKLLHIKIIITNQIWK